MTPRDQYHSDRLIVKLTLLLCSTLIIFAAASVSPSLPLMQEHFTNLKNADFWVKMVAAIPSLFILLGAPIIGIGVDRVGRKLILVVSVILFGLFGTSGFFVSSIFGILATRAGVGLATAGITTSVTTLIGDYYTGQNRIQVLGLQSAFIGVGAITAVLSGGILADFSWRSPFLVHLLAFLLLPLVLFLIQEPQRIQDGQLESIDDFENRSNLLEQSPSSEAVDAENSQKVLLFIYGTALLGEVILYLIPLQTPFYLRALAGANGKQAGIAVALATLFFITGSLLYVKLKERMSYVSLIILSLGLVGISYEVIGWVNSYALVLLGLAIGGLGSGFLVPNLDSWLTATVPAAYRGRAVGKLTASTFLGQFLSPIITQPVIKNLNLELENAYALVYILSGYSAILFVLVIFIFEQVKRNEFSTRF
ncbi:MAG: MFS transporter [Synechococcales bacterium]|nr:MFS transporter [Synechococcales bacterium]